MCFFFEKSDTTCETDKKNNMFEGLSAFLHPFLAALCCLPHLCRLGQRHLQQVGCLAVSGGVSGRVSRRVSDKVSCRYR